MNGSINAVFLTGDSALIREWSELIHSRGIGIVVNATSRQDSGEMPSYCASQENPPHNCQAAFELTVLDGRIKEQNIRRLDESLPPGIPVFTSSVACSTAEQASWVRHPGRLLGISAFPTLTARELVEIAPSIHTSKKTISSAEDMFIVLNKKIAVIQDRVGMVLPRILCSVINEAFFAAMDGIASVEDIDSAMKMGAGFPHGPIEWANSIGLPYVVSVVEAVYRDTGDERYRIAPSLRQLALGTKWWNG